MQEQIVSFNLTNNTNGTIPMSIMGNNTDVMDNSNATTQYYWNLTGFSLTIEDTVTIQYKYVGQSNFSTISVPFSGTNLQNVADALNSLNIGTFFLTTSGGNTYLNNYTQYLVYGQLDITSSTVVGGSINTSFVVSTGFNNVVYSIAIQSDGKVLVGGTFTSYQGTGANRIIRLNIDGSIDPTFVYGTGFNSDVFSIVIQTDGNIVVGGNFTSYQGTGANYIIRLTSTGAIDPTFVYVAGFNSNVNSIAIQTDGNIVVGGAFTSYQGTGANRIIRLTTTGAIDGTFVYGAGFNNVIPSSGIAIQSDGKIICVGIFTSYQGTGANSIIRLTTTGAIDGTFVYGTGFVSNAYNISIQTDGNIVVGGNFTSYQGTGANSIIRLTSTGAIDPTFVYGAGFDSIVRSTSIQSDGKIVVVGSFTTYQGISANKIIRLNTDGSIDTSFVYGTGLNAVAWTLALTPSLMYVGGGFNSYQGQSYNRIISLYQ